ETRDTALTLSGYLVAIRRVQIAQRNLAVELGLHRANRKYDCRSELGVRNLLDGLAAGNALLKDILIVQRAPNYMFRCLNLALTRNIHAYDPPNTICLSGATCGAVRSVQPALRLRLR